MVFNNYYLHKMLSTEILTTAKSTAFLWQLTIKQFLGNSDRQSFIHTVLISRPLMIMQNMHWNIGTNITNPMLKKASNCCWPCLSKCSKSFTFGQLTSYKDSILLNCDITWLNHMMQSAPVAYSNQNIFNNNNDIDNGNNWLHTIQINMLLIYSQIMNKIHNYYMWLRLELKSVRVTHPQKNENF